MTKKFKHNRTAYTHRKCRCDVCVQANRDYQREYLHRRIAARIVDRHGKRVVDSDEKLA